MSSLCICLQERVAAIQAAFLAAMTYNEGSLVFPGDADFDFLVILSALEQNLLVRLDVEVRLACCTENGRASAYTDVLVLVSVTGTCRQRMCMHSTAWRSRKRGAKAT